VPKSSALSFLGIAREPGFATATAATAYIPVTSLTPKDSLTLLPDKGWRGSMVEQYGEVAGPVSATVDFGGDVFPDTIGWPLAGVLGDVVTTGSSVPYATAFAVLNNGNGQPGSFTFTDNYVAGVRQYAGGKFSDMSFKFSPDGMITYTAKATTLGSVPTTAPTPAFSALKPIAAWNTTVSLGGTAAAGIMDAEVDIKRPVTLVKAVDGTQFPYQIWSGVVSVSGKFTIVMESDTQLTNYLTGASQVLDISFTNGTGAALVGLDLHMSNVTLSGAEISRGKDYIELSCNYAANANTTDVGASAGYSPIKATLTNAIASGTY